MTASAAASGAAALESLPQPAGSIVILLDVMMPPEMDGLQGL